MIGLLAQLTGLVITILIKIILAVFLLRSCYTGFYRKKVNQVNISGLMIESIMVGFAVGTALVRAIKLVLISSLYIGRMDTPLLAPGVGGRFFGDRYPEFFRKELLCLEAHRHPYIDVLGKMYLLKLRYRNSFCSRAGYCYRLIFTLALMPWLRKYRILHLLENAEVDDPDAGGSFRAVLVKDVQRASMRGGLFATDTKKLGRESAGETLPEGEEDQTAEQLRRRLFLKEKEVEQLRRQIDVLLEESKSNYSC